ncbi:30S ribosomal protein S8 [candidate division WOR-1 bacterium RIFCSPLOWO2_02_FULL_46_20]|uniref:Small ribosomal subunit protein uS8 n=2 Tax=Saganbacteria TaxID=1703751 RepID=A0A1F4R513_UNCSA|nr:MAG: 30S ribosomal protein S8 [candidate division WOR-1 bacterium RIFCSPHIGHO2_02_FULL_45_12]OGC03262.1 MAG: 30S ribosomal protein S8 [candidate division WOR-1 bacterium RIFCSPLOWO2_02_FULL_46_20]OGC08908.1 MAG: 30S ribosomal protein S8 [candidate division WOR-1 bacterium RIFCSPLOWO2_12_FULL_45_9]
MTDPIADMLIRIKNAQSVRSEVVDVPHSKIKEGIAKILVAEGYVGRLEVLKRMEKKYVRLQLKYKPNKKGLICDIKRISRPGRRIYKDARSLPEVQSGFGTAIISTSKGLMNDETARTQKLGGEVVCYVW